jgi:hypothetical protein
MTVSYWVAWWPINYVSTRVIPYCLTEQTIELQLRVRTTGLSVPGSNVSLLWDRVCATQLGQIVPCRGLALTIMNYLVPFKDQAISESNRRNGREVSFEVSSLGQYIGQHCYSDKVDPIVLCLEYWHCHDCFVLISQKITAQHLHLNLHLAASFW